MVLAITQLQAAARRLGAPAQRPLTGLTMASVRPAILVLMPLLQARERPPTTLLPVLRLGVARAMLLLRLHLLHAHTMRQRQAFLHPHPLLPVATTTMLTLHTLALQHQVLVFLMRRHLLQALRRVPIVSHSRIIVLASMLLRLQQVHLRPTPAVRLMRLHLRPEDHDMRMMTTKIDALALSNMAPRALFAHVYY